MNEKIYEYDAKILMFIIFDKLNCFAYNYKCN